MIHVRKCESDYFQAVIDGKKPFEIREEGETYVFSVGDFLALNEIHEDVLTGRCCLVEITYILRDPRFVLSGQAILGIRPCRIDSVLELFGRCRTNEAYSVSVYGGAAHA